MGREEIDRRFPSDPQPVTGLAGQSLGNLLEVLNELAHDIAQDAPEGRPKSMALSALEEVQDRLVRAFREDMSDGR